MGGFPPPPGNPNPPPPPQGGFPPPGAGGWPAPPAGGPGETGEAPPQAGPFGAPSSYGPFGAPSPYGPPPGYGGQYAPKAGFWARFAALIIDGIVTGLFAIPAYIALWTGPTEIEGCSLDESGDIDPTGTVENGLCEVPTPTTWAIFGVLVALALVAAIVYYAKLEGGSGQTLGKRALGIKVVDSRTGGSIGTGRGVGRYFARILSALVCYLGYLWMLWDREQQCWHDKLVNSYVVKA